VNPWEVLGVPEGTSDPREIRRAYAAKVREHPPDSDAEGFRLVREAYEALRKRKEALAAFGEPAHEGAPSRPEEEAAWRAERKLRSHPDAVPEDIPAPLREARDDDPEPSVEAELAAIDGAAALPAGEERDGALCEALRTLADRARADPRLVAAWSRAMLQVAWDARDPSLAVRCARIGDVLLDLVEGEGEVALRIVATLRGRGDLTALAKLARAILETDGEPRQGIEHVVLPLATSLALLDPSLARDLADHAFRQRAQGRGESSEWQELDRRLAAAKELGPIEPGLARFLSLLLDGRRGTGPESRRAASAARRRVATLPEESALVALLHERAPGLLEASKAGTAKPWGWGKYVATIWLVVILARACGEFAGERGPPLPRDTERMLRDMEKILERARETEKRSGLQPRTPPKPPASPPLPER